MTTKDTTEIASHTPGPWALHRPGSMRACDGRHDTENGCCTIVEAEILNMPRAEAEANARLIAAAPELLAALKAMVASYDDLRDVLTCDVVIQKLARADAAIQKAEGAR